MSSCHCACEVPVTSIFIKNLRNIAQARIELCPGINFLVGENGSGKTSILEGFDILSTGHSFRTNRKTDLIKLQQDSLLIGATLEQNGSDQKLSVQKERNGKTVVTVNGSSGGGFAEAASLFPVRAFHPDSHLLVQGGSSERRRFLDWGVFHVKPGFVDCWNRYRRCLQQRNALLKQRRPQSRPEQWDGQMIEYAAELDESRSEYFHSWRTVVRDFLSELKPGKELIIEYDRGWPADRDLADVLEENYPSDRELGATRFGPHRADMHLTWDGLPAKSTASRGQQKVIALVLTLAQIRHFVRTHDREGIVLIDDLASELDAKHRKWALGELKRLEQQTIVTQTENGLDLSPWPEMKVFHVKQGTVTEIQSVSAKEAESSSEFEEVQQTDRIFRRKCIACGIPIPQTRVLAMPDIKRCSRCQTEFEKRNPPPSAPAGEVKEEPAGNQQDHEHLHEQQATDVRAGNDE